METAADFGAGLRAHLGLERAELELVATPEAAGLARRAAALLATAQVLDDEPARLRRRKSGV